MIARLRLCSLALGVILVTSVCDPGGAEAVDNLNQQAVEDAKHDRSTLIFDGQDPNKLACDTTLRELSDGSWVMVMLGGGNTEPLPLNQVFLTRSQDQGKSWSSLAPLDLGFPRAGNTIAMVPSELMVHEDRCTLFVATHDGTFAGWNEWMTHSTDNCRTWSEPRPAPGQLHDRTFVRNHITTHDGRILLPFQHYKKVGETRSISGNRRFSPPQNPRNGVLMSGDGGKTWTEHGKIRLSKEDDYHGWAENNIVELADGRIAMIIRADRLGGVLYFAESSDGGKTWPEYATQTKIPNPGSKATLYPLGGDTVALLHNPNPKHRSPLALWISFDGLKTWPYRRILVPESVDGPKGRLNYPDGFVSEDKQWLHFAYDDNRHQAVQYSAKLPPISTLKTSARNELKVDVCVYGGTSGGVAAAVQAARMGKTVALVEPGGHLGGMTSGGLSAVDIGDPRSVGGIAREYFTRLVATYGKELNWGEKFKSHGGPSTGGAYSIEPHVAERVFDELAREAGVIVLRNTPLKSVEKEGLRISRLITADGGAVQAKMFIDTTYEGDLMAAAEVSYTLMREGNHKYGESYNGIHYSSRFQPRKKFDQPRANGRLPSGLGAWDRDFPLDPYVVEGDPASGLLPLVNEGEPGTPGEAAPGIQAYCFRLCLTTDKSNMLSIIPPADYDPRNYELVVRFIEACLLNGDDMDLRWFSKHDPLPHDKWDFNTATFGGNLPGANWEWPEASYAERKQYAQRIEDYHRGLLHFLKTDPRVPQKVRKDMSRFGLPKDEFTDHGGWPHQIYIREGRRMVGDFVMTEHHTFGREIAEKCIGLGSYGTDAHEIRRIVKEGVVTREGKIATGRGGFGPYQIGYDAIVPRQSECENLLVTFALSASHSAFASIRMEPVFMVTSQSASTAACIAIDDAASVQKTDYQKLKQQLLKDGQILEWTHTKRKVVSRNVNRPEDLPGIVLDDESATFVGEWSSSNAQPPWVGKSYRHDGNSDRGQKSAKFTLRISNSGIYEVRLLYSHFSNRSSKVPVTIHFANGEKTVIVNQKQPAVLEGIPRSLGLYSFEAGQNASIVISNEGADGYVSIDGIQLVPQDVSQQERSGQLDAGFVKTEQ